MLTLSLRIAFSILVLSQRVRIYNSVKSYQEYSLKVSIKSLLSNFTFLSTLRVATILGAMAL